MKHFVHSFFHKATQKRSWEDERNSMEVNLREAESKLRDAESKLREAESRLGELEKQSNDLTLEKSRLLDRIDSLEAGNERFFEMKEKQVRRLFSNKLVCLIHTSFVSYL